MDEDCPICYIEKAEYFTECGHKYCINCLSRLKSCAHCRKTLLRSIVCGLIKSHRLNKKNEPSESIRIYHIYKILAGMGGITNSIL